MIARSLLALLVTGPAIASTTDDIASFSPSLQSARKNGPQIFNAIHNAMREFGSALDHNGMSLFPAVIPEGVLLYHGTRTSEVPDTLEWLAFEIEHAQSFALLPPPRPPPLDLLDQDEDKWDSIQHDPWDIALAFQGPDHPPKVPPKDPPRGPTQGFLHIYQASRPLKVLYIDGMAAGKTDMGTTDTQDLLLTDNRNRSAWGDFQRARDLCNLAKQWEIDGFIRMEPGFEVIFCDFKHGLRLVSTNQQPPQDDPAYLSDREMSSFEWARAASQRYNGIGSSRVMVDYSSMVSAFFYPLNLTNPNPKSPELPRLLNATDTELQLIRQHAANATSRAGKHAGESVNWQGVTDMIVSRFADRLLQLVETESFVVFKHEINNLLNIYIDYATEDIGFRAARQRCNTYYLQPVKARTEEDQLIWAGVETTTEMICTALFEARQFVVENLDTDSLSVAAGKAIIRDLMDTLRWSKWKECGPCQSNEVCFVAMWPFGNVEDHFHPSCLNTSVVAGRSSYWGRPRPPPRPPGSHPPCKGGPPCEPGEDLEVGEL